MAASNGSPADAASIPLEEVVASVEAFGFSAALNDMAAATLSSSVSIFDFFSLVYWSKFSFLGQFLS